MGLPKHCTPTVVLNSCFVLLVLTFRNLSAYKLAFMKNRSLLLLLKLITSNGHTVIDEETTV